MFGHPLLIAVACVFGLWFVVGLVLSVRQSVRRAGEEGYSKALGGVVGVILALPPEVYLTALAVLAVVVWQAI